jgi:hypothetical protein
MATSFQKNYSVDVTFTKENPGGTASIVDTEIQCVQLRAEIIEAIDRVCRRTKGNYNTQPGTVTET